ncbi:MAG: threonylcarbamoyl-AMP synthase [Crocinitomicaceae bacterium]|nr:threonylcarbamoyl-AMP synthase [Crocinitomicaceae bacterium]
MQKTSNQIKYQNNLLMYTKVWSNNHNSSKIDSAINVLNNGGIILYPTETIWAIGCKSILKNSVKRVYDIKKRPYNIPLINLIDSIKNIPKYVENLNIKDFELIKKNHYFPTVIYPNCKSKYRFLANDLNEISFRISPVNELKEIISKLDSPIISSSANISGENFPESLDNISKSIINSVDLILNFEVKSSGIPSEVIKINNGKIEYLRK